MAKRGRKSWEELKAMPGKEIIRLIEQHHKRAQRKHRKGEGG